MESVASKAVQTLSVEEVCVKKTIHRLLALAMLVVAPFAVAQDDYAEREAAELARQQAFREGMEAIVADLNRQSFVRFVTAIDTDDMVERIFGLRLIDQRIRGWHQGDAVTCRVARRSRTRSGPIRDVAFPDQLHGIRPRAERGWERRHQ